MAGHGEKRSRKEDDAITALLASSTLAEAAKVAGVGEKTLWRWTQDPAFQKRYREARQSVVQHSIATIQRAMTSAVETLERNLTCGTANVEVTAARAILEQGLKATELDDLMARLEEIERAVADPKPPAA